MSRCVPLLQVIPVRILGPGIISWCGAREALQEQTGPLILYAVNLVLNLAWMPVSLSSGLPFRAICSIFLHGNHLLCLWCMAGIVADRSDCSEPVVQIFFNQKNFQLAQIDNLGKCSRQWLSWPLSSIILQFTDDMLSFTVENCVVDDKSPEAKIAGDLSCCKVDLQQPLQLLLGRLSGSTRSSQWQGYLLWPYVAFLTYANCLNYFHLKENGVSIVIHVCSLALSSMR